MRLVRFNGGRIGVVRDGRVYDVSAACNVDPVEWPPMGMVRTIANFASLRARIDAAAGDGVALGDVRLDVPVPWPHNLFAFPVNYDAHKTEMNSPNRADKNGFFLKAASSLVGPADAIELPDMPGREFHHECELALIVGKRGRNVPRSEALDYVFGYACIIDVTLRGTEERVMRKSFDTFSPLGPWIVTADEVGNPADIRMRLWVNGELRQDGNTRDLIVDIPGMIGVMSAAATIEPGDVVATGTPAGVGPILPGDRVAIDIERVGRMELPVVVAAMPALR